MFFIYIKIVMHSITEICSSITHTLIHNLLTKPKHFLTAKHFLSYNCTYCCSTNQNSVHLTIHTTTNNNNNNKDFLKHNQANITLKADVSASL